MGRATPPGQEPLQVVVRLRQNGLEARRDSDYPDGRWFFSVARMTSPQLEIRLGDALIWTGLPYWNNPRSKDDPYVEAFEGVYEPEGE
jgi:hypothetical protein